MTGTFVILSLPFFSLKACLALLPVLVFLGILVLLDSYKLVPLHRILQTIGIGIVCALCAYLLNSVGFRVFAPQGDAYMNYGVPLLEEILKGSYIVYLVRKQRIGFAVDAAIIGFAIGAGFAFQENLVYLSLLPDATLLTWIVRGFGTAIMHGSTTAFFAVLACNVAERREGRGPWIILPGLVLAFLVHSFYNQAVLSPVFMTVLIAATVPVLLTLVFSWSENSLRQWLGEGFDRDVELLRMISTGTFLQTRAGKFLLSLTKAFPPATVADMLCALRIRVELALRVKGDLLKREAGFPVVPDQGTLARLRELRYLEKSIGPTGRLAMSPLFPKGSRDAWQLERLGYR
ncbi:MAG: PrsW family intramembrane metalloprotease [Acidobacteria bacterium]|nr:MAG: PrsW family intramembrane metalloprotease [Acidobacteriota bacterium]